MRQIILSDRYNTNEVIKEEKELWVINLLILLGVSADDIDINNPDALFKYNIQVWDHIDNGDVEIIQNDVLVGKWYMPLIIAKYDNKNNIYYEIHLDYDSILDNEFHSIGDE